MIYKFYTALPKIMREEHFYTLDNDIVTIRSEEILGERKTEISTEKEGVTSSIALIKLIPLLSDDLKFCHPVSDYEKYEYSLEYGFWCREIGGKIYQSDYGNYGVKPDWATHFTEYGRQ